MDTVDSQSVLGIESFTGSVKYPITDSTLEMIWYIAKDVLHTYGIATRYWKHEYAFVRQQEL